MGAAARNVPAADRQWPAGLAHGCARRDRGVFHLRAVAHRLGLFRGLPWRLAPRAEIHRARGPCAGLRGAGLAHLRGSDRLSGADRPLGLDGAAGVDRVFAVGRLCHGGKLAQQLGHQRDARPVAVGLHAGADVRPCGGAGHPQRGRSVGLSAVHHPVDPRLAELRADPVVGLTRPGLRGVARHEPRAALIEPRPSALSA
jgi:hypothetical protein